MSNKYYVHGKDLIIGVQGDYADTEPRMNFGKFLGWTPPTEGSPFGQPFISALGDVAHPMWLEIKPDMAKARIIHAALQTFSEGEEVPLEIIDVIHAAMQDIN